MRMRPFGILDSRAIARSFVAIAAGLAVVSVATALHAAEDTRIATLDVSGGAPAPAPIFAGEVVVCAVTLPGAPALFGVDTVDPSAADKTFLQGELLSPFRVFEIDELCNVVATFSTALAAGTQAGVAVASTDPSRYWIVEAASGRLDEFVVGTGVATGGSVALPPTSGGYGPAVVDDHEPGDVACVGDIVLDTFVCLDLASGAPVCSFANADDVGGGAFGNGVGDAQDPDACAATSLVVASGMPGEGQVVRVGQYDCDAVDPLCRDRWDVAPFSTFINGIDETEIDGQPILAVADNVTATFLLLTAPVVEPGCGPIDADMNLVYVNGSRGDAAFRVAMPASGTLGVANQRTPGGNGRFVHQMHSGQPGVGTLAPLFDLGTSCFSFLDGSAIVVENNVGRTDRVGASSYFGTSIPDPPRAPTFLGSLTQAELDAANLPAGSAWTLQAVHRNAAASSKLGASLSNPVVLEIE